MKARIGLALALLLGALLLAPTASAGGWAAVRFVDSQDDSPVVGQPWHAELVVRQHDLDPINVDLLTLRFQHQETTENLQATGTATGEIGHYAIDVTFPRAGVWNLTANPSPFPPVSMASIEVANGDVDQPATSLTATLVVGTCTAPGKALTSVGLGGEDDPLIASGAGSFAPSIGDDGYAMVIADSAKQNAMIACGEVAAAKLAAPATVHLTPQGDSLVGGVLLLQPSGSSVLLSLVLTNTAPAAGVIVRITDIGGGSYQPSNIRIPAGTSVTWINESSMSHTVSARSDGFANSGVLGPGERFTQTFSTPGDYKYGCDPHEWMTGVVSVVD